MIRSNNFSYEIKTILSETNVSDPIVAIRLKARSLLTEYTAIFGELTLPVDLASLISFRGIHLSDESPAFSDDAELLPTAKGITIRVNRDRPETRQRFSLAHEVIHTCFPGFEKKVQCRTDHRFRDALKMEELLESLCDVGASELLFPIVPFFNLASDAKTASAIISLADLCIASREATIRRYVETHPDPIAALFLEWKTKPTQDRRLDPNQGNLFGLNPVDEARLLQRLRVNYCISSESFRAKGYFIPQDKSLPTDGAIGEAARTGEPQDSQEVLDLGSLKGRFSVRSIPLFTSREELGPNGENGVAIIIQPLSLDSRAISNSARQQILF